MRRTFQENFNDFSIFNNVLLRDPKKREDIDHIIVGPSGVFVIEPKNNWGRITFNGFAWKGVKGSPSQQAKDKMFKVKDALKYCSVFQNKGLFIEQSLDFSNPKAVINKSTDPEHGSEIVHLRGLSDTTAAEWIKNKSIRFSDQEVAKIEQCLRTRIVN